MTCAKDVLITISNVTIKLIRGREVTYNSHDLQLPFMTESIQIMQQGLFTVVMVKTDEVEFTLEWDGS